jgi:hypothetical protein
MPPAPQQTEARREQLRQQAIQRRQAVIDRIVATRALVLGGAVAITCVLAGYLEASAKTTTSSSSTASTSGSYGPGYSGGSADNYGDAGQSAAQGLFGGGSPPSSSSGAGAAVSGGS